MSTISYLGPEGTFTHQAAVDLALTSETLLPLASTAEVVQSVESGACSTGVVAFENNLEGDVSANLDELLLQTSRCLIAAERVLAVTFTLFRAVGDDSELVGVASHPFCLNQCSRFIEAAKLKTRETSSTAAACRELADTPTPGWGALGPPATGALYGLRPQLEHLENDGNATTRFVGLRTVCGGATGKDRSAFSFRPEQDESGSLVRLLQEFSLRDINLTAIKSRPTKELLGEYIFYIECEGHIQEARTRDAVLGVLRLQPQTRFLGSFPEDSARPPRQLRDKSVAENAYTQMLDTLG
jgi:prephenate dehydratase